MDSSPDSSPNGSPDGSPTHITTPSEASPRKHVLNSHRTGEEIQSPLQDTSRSAAPAASTTESSHERASSKPGNDEDKGTDLWAKARDYIEDYLLEKQNKAFPEVFACGWEIDMGVNDYIHLTRYLRQMQAESTEKLR